MEISQDQLLGEGDYADVQRQSVYGEHTLGLCYTVALNAWNRTGEIGKKVKSFTKVLYRAQRKPSYISYKD